MVKRPGEGFGPASWLLIQSKSLSIVIVFAAVLVSSSCSQAEQASIAASAPATSESPASTSSSDPGATSPSSQWEPVDSLEDIKYDPNTPESILTSGGRSFSSACSACHELPTAERIREFPTDEALTEFMIPMTEVSELPLDYSEKVIRYLLTVRRDIAP